MMIPKFTALNQIQWGPLIVGVVLFLLLNASMAYWAKRIFGNSSATIGIATAHSYPADAKKPRIDAIGNLFGSPSILQDAKASYRLEGTITTADPRDSVAILGIEKKPSRIFRVGSEVTPGTIVKEVHHDSVVLSENGMDKVVSASGQMHIVGIPAGNSIMQRATEPVFTEAPPVVAPPVAQESDSTEKKSIQDLFDTLANAQIQSGKKMDFYKSPF